MMKVICMMCGKKEGLDEDHVDFNKYENNPKAVYICPMCSAKTFFEAKEGQKLPKPI